MHYAVVLASVGYIIQSMNGPRHDERGRPVIGLVGDSRPAHFGAWRDIDVCLAWSHYLDAISPERRRRPDRAARAAPRRAPRAPARPHRRPAADRRSRPRRVRLRRRAPSGQRAGRSGSRRCRAGSRHRGARPRPADPRRLPRHAAAQPGRRRRHRPAPRGSRSHPPGRARRVRHAFAGGRGREPRSSRSSAPSRRRSARIITRASADLGAGLRISARAPDGLVEAVERDAGAEGFCLAVLWHPEEDLEGGGLALYGALVAASSERRERVAA